MIPTLMPTYVRSEYAFERGEGAYLYDLQGEKYLDFAAGIAVSALGHSHPHLVEALARQGAKLWHVSNLYRIPEAERLAERLVAHSFADTVFFGNSGAEAGELAIKIARRYHYCAGNPGRYRVIAFNSAFHGRTLATIAAGGNEKHLAGFAPAVDGFDHVPFDNMNELRHAIRPDTAAIMIEPVQGEGGIRPASPRFLRALREVADEYGLLLIFDEVQCGLGRTGRLWAHEHADITPDIMMVAKGLGGGFPIGAVLATERAAACMTPGTHGSTYGGGPLATEIGNAVLDVVLAPGFRDGVERHGRLLAAGLEGLVRRHPAVLAGERGMGLMRGLVCRVPNTDFLAAMRGQKLLAVTASDNVVRLVPPLIVGPAEIDEALAKLDAACASFDR